jgi:hypothetical protein
MAKRNIHRRDPQMARQSRAAVTSSFLILPSYFPGCGPLRPQQHRTEHLVSVVELRHYFTFSCHSCFPSSPVSREDTEDRDLVKTFPGFRYVRLRLYGKNRFRLSSGRSYKNHDRLAAANVIANRVEKVAPRQLRICFRPWKIGHVSNSLSPA